MTRIGVLALQGDFAEHAKMLHSLGVEPVEVRNPEHLRDLDGLIIPGGESTTMRRLANSAGLTTPLRDFAVAHPTWGTCAGAIMLAKEVEGETMPLGVMDICVLRNAFGRQIDSFTQALTIDEIGGGPYHAIFIRAPIIRSVGDGVQVLCALDDGRIVAARQGHLLATSFHPELTDDPRVHEYFVKMAK